VEERAFGVEPRERRKDREPRGVEALRCHSQELARRQDAVRADEAFDLHPERDERGEIDRAQDADEEPDGDDVSRRGPPMWGRGVVGRPEAHAPL
jgi:hypothetical protein